MNDHRPRLVALSAASLALLGVAAVLLAPSRNESLIVAGVLGVVASPLVWFGVRYARWVGIAAAMVALLPGIHGLGSMAVVAQQFASCSDGSVASVASIVATSYPENYCEIVNWPRQFGISFGLISVGLAGAVILFGLKREAVHFDRHTPLGG